MNYKFGVYGDSIAFGYGNNNQSWFDELYLGNEALKLAQNGEKIEDVLSNIKQDNNHYDTLFFADTACLSGNFIQRIKQRQSIKKELKKLSLPVAR